MQGKTKLQNELSGEEIEFFLSALPSEEFKSKLRSNMYAQHQRLTKGDSTKMNTNIGRKPLFSTLTLSFRILWVPCVLFLTLFAIIGMAYSYGNIKGYLHGFGLTDPASTFRTLSSPVSQIRDGVEVKIISAITDANHTAIVYSTSGVSASAFPGEFSPMSTKQQICAPRTRLILPDQTELQPFWSGAIGYSSEGAYQKIAMFEPIPDTVKSLTFTLSCIEGTLPNAAPEKWEIRFRIDSSHKNLKIVEPQVFTVNLNGPSIIKVQITEVFQLGSKLLIIGRANDEPNSPLDIKKLDDISFADSNGTKLSWDIPGDIVTDSMNGKDGIFAFAIDVSSNQFPVTMEIGSVVGTCEGVVPLELDLSGILANGKEHPFSKQLDFNGCSLQLTGVTRTSHSLTLYLSSGDYLLENVAIEASDTNSKIMLEEKTPGELMIHVNYKTPISNNLQTFRFEYPSIRIVGPWTGTIELEDGG